MEEFLKFFSSLKKDQFSVEALRQIILKANPFVLDLKELDFPEPEEGSYSRFKILSNPLTISVVRWPPSGESAIHLHNDFCGYVAVVEGIIENRIFDLDENFTYFC